MVRARPRITSTMRPSTAPGVPSGTMAPVEGSSDTGEPMPSGPADGDGEGEGVVEWLMPSASARSSAVSPAAAAVMPSRDVMRSIMRFVASRRRRSAFTSASSAAVRAGRSAADSGKPSWRRRCTRRASMSSCRCTSAAEARVVASSARAPASRAAATDARARSFLTSALTLVVAERMAANLASAPATRLL